MRRTALAPLASCLFIAAALPVAAHAAGARVPWADPIGTSPPLGTAQGTPSVPYADPIGASRINPQAQPQVQPRQPLHRAPAQRRCYRAVDAYGRTVTRCTVVR